MPAQMVYVAKAMEKRDEIDIEIHPDNTPREILKFLFDAWVSKTIRCFRNHESGDLPLEYKIGAQHRPFGHIRRVDYATGGSYSQALTERKRRLASLHSSTTLEWSTPPGNGWDMDMPVKSIEQFKAPGDVMRFSGRDSDFDIKIDVLLINKDIQQVYFPAKVSFPRRLPLKTPKPFSLSATSARLDVVFPHINKMAFQLRDTLAFCPFPSSNYSAAFLRGGDEFPGYDKV
ncbi:MAG: hypothetical protein SGARI_007221, partial [Bacillariaceae sp.]